MPLKLKNRPQHQRYVAYLDQQTHLRSEANYRPSLDVIANDLNCGKNINSMAILTICLWIVPVILFNVTCQIPTVFLDAKPI